jgi:hypothetical protein
MIRDFSLGQIFKNQNGAYTSRLLKEVCYGRGYTMVEGKMIPLGICTNSKVKDPRISKFSDNKVTKNYFGKCVAKKGAYINRLNIHAQNNQTYSERIDRMEGKNYLSGLKLGGAAFMQKHVESHLKNLSGAGFDNVHLNHMSNSSQALPNYTNGDLNSKGYTFNPSP